MRALPTIIAALAASVSLSLPSFAATLRSVSGQVLINRGTGYKPVTTGAEAKTGDVVMARPGASAQLVYADGCKTAVSPGSVVTIGAESPCAGAYAQVGPQTDWRPYLIAGAALAAAGGGTYLIVRSQKKSTPFVAAGPASP